MQCNIKIKNGIVLLAVTGIVDFQGCYAAPSNIVICVQKPNYGCLFNKQLLIVEINLTSVLLSKQIATVETDKAPPTHPLLLIICRSLVTYLGFYYV